MKSVGAGCGAVGIAVDCRYVRLGHHDGISRYTAGIVAELGKLHPVIMLISDRRQLAMLPDLPSAIISPPTSPWEPFVARQLNRLAVDVVFTPMQTMGSAGRRYRLVRTVHDLIYYAHPTPPRDLPGPIRLLWRLYHLSWWPQRLLLNRCDAVVVVSETTKRLVSDHRLTRRPLVVVPNAATQVEWTPELQDPHRRGKHLVYMGSFMPYKNVETLIRAMALLPDYTLHLMSRISVADRDRLAKLAPQAKLRFHNGATDQEYHRLLRTATALLSASEDEGFGIPLVEAMVMGTPVVVSDIEIFAEIAGAAGIIVPGHDPQAFADAVRTLADPVTWSERSKLARRQAAAYSWAESAKTLLELLLDLAATDRDQRLRDQSG